MAGGKDTQVFFEPGLAEGPPRLLPRAREFLLPKDAFWSNGEPVTASDVRQTLKLLKEGKAAGRTPSVMPLRTSFLKPFASKVIS